MQQELVLLCGNKKKNLLEQVVKFLQKKNVCRGCDSCQKCRLIFEKKDPAIRFFDAEGPYNLELCDQILGTTALALSEGESFCFVLPEVDKLLPGAANRLLKTLEEPPPGYNFVFTTTNKDAVLPTIVSRCTKIIHFNFEKVEDHPLFLFFTKNYFEKNIDDFNTTLVELDDLGEAESQDIFAAIVECFLELSVNGKASENDLYKLEVFQQYSFFLPRPGGVKGFWQSLFLSTVG